MSCWIGVREDPQLSVVTHGPTDQGRTGPGLVIGGPSLVLIASLAQGCKASGRLHAEEGSNARLSVIQPSR